MYVYLEGQIEIDFMNERGTITTRTQHVAGTVLVESLDAVDALIDANLDRHYPVRFASRVGDFTKIEVKQGDRVHWAKTGQSGRTISIQRREGTIQAFNGETALVKTSSKKPAVVPVGVLRPMGVPNEVDRVMRAVRKSATEEASHA